MIEYLVVILVGVSAFCAGHLAGLMFARHALEREARRIMAAMEATRNPSMHSSRSTGATYIPPERRNDG